VSDTTHADACTEAGYKKYKMKIRILAFGIVKDIFGNPTIEVNVEGASVDALKNSLEERYPRLKQITSYMIAVNNEYAQAGQSISELDEIAIIPPVSGG
jgi:molybdopterin converting factor subunit 1